MCGEHVAVAAVLPYVWSDACRDRVLFHPSCRFSMRMEHIARRRRTVRARWLFLHTHGAHSNVDWIGVRTSFKAGFSAVLAGLIVLFLFGFPIIAMVYGFRL